MPKNFLSQRVDVVHPSLEAVCFDTAQRHLQKRVNSKVIVVLGGTLCRAN